ncbi:MAG: DUF6458 family protein [Solirubrobacterales bacterium]
MQPVSAGFSLFLIVLGAILRYAVTWDPEGVDLDVIGLILMIAGLIGVCIWLIWFLVGRSDRQQARYEAQRAREQEYYRQSGGPPPPPR